MAEHYADGQYDDDLTVGLDDLTDDTYFDEGDLLKYQSSEDESPLSRLKTLVLSLDWEITDEVLQQCNEELVALRDIWEGENLYLVYVQALSTICKYIYQEKTNAHANALKLLPLLYNNLEKIVHDESLEEKERRDILLTDVSRFNELKQQIGGVSGKNSVDKALQNIKAIVLTIDWEVSKNDIRKLAGEIATLESSLKNRKPCLILLQGIGTIAAYIQHKAGNGHADAFSLIHDFYLTLEKFISSKLTPEQEKELLFVEVEKFNAFKEVISSTISPEALARDVSDSDTEENAEMEEESETGEIQPAFADVEPENIAGFQEEQAAEDIEQEVDITNKLETFFADTPGEIEHSESMEPEVFETSEAEETSDSVIDEAESRLEDFFDESVFSEDDSVDKATALKGVNVETEADDDSDEDALPELDGELAPALADNDTQSSFSEDALDDIENEPEELGVAALTEATDSLEEDDIALTQDEDTSIDFIDETQDFTAALADVESEDDEELSVPLEDDVPAPALSGFESDTNKEDAESEFDDQLDIDSRLDAFFGNDDEEAEESVSDEVDLLKEYFDEDQNKEVFEESILQFDDTTEEHEDESSVEETINEFFAVDEDEVRAVSSPAESAYAEDDDVESPVDEFFSTDSEDESSSVDQSIEDFFALDEETSTTDQEQNVESLSESFSSFDEEDVSELQEDELSVEESVNELFDTDAPALTIEDQGQETADLEDEDSSFGLSDGVVAATVAAGVATAAVAVAAENVNEQIDRAEEELLSEPEKIDDEYSVQFLEVDEETPETLLSQGQDRPYENLRGCIHSLGIEINDQITDGLISEINFLRQRSVADPLAKSFLQLMSTVGQHIRQHQSESGTEAYELLLSVFEGMEKALIGSSNHEAQEIFLAEMYKVLSWQQTIMIQEVSENSIEGDVSSGIVDSLEDEQEDDEHFVDGEDELLYAVLEEEIAEASEEESDTVGVDDIRSELQSLRQTLQDEIAQLRAELTK